MTSPALMSKSNFFTTLSNSPDSMMLSNHINVNTLPFTFLGDESCSEVSSSSPITCGGPSPPPLVSMGIPNFNNSEITELHDLHDHGDVSVMHDTVTGTPETNIDLNFWELAINATSPSQMFGTVPVSSTTAGINARSFSFFSEDGTSPVGREDLSPSSSINSTSLISESGDKKKKGSGARQTEELCLVCGDRASGYHYNALTCEGCKGFFRRSITKKAVYSCKYGQHCEMDMYMRRKCQECRFKKCISVGMRPECVVPEHTCQVKREQKKAREKDKGIKVEFCAIPDLPPPPPEQYVPGFPSGLPNLPSSLKSGARIELTKEHQELINRLINNQDEFETPPEDSMTSIPNGNDDEARYQQITEMTKLTVELVVKFALNLPGFSNVPVEDQVTLLKACTSELITLRASRRYHADSDSIVFANNSPCTKEFYKSAGMNPAFSEALFAFCKRMATMKVDNAEYALLAGISLFSERPCLTNPDIVEKIQFLYVETLYAYVTNKWAPKSGTMIAKLLDVLTQLRSLGIMNSVQCETFVNEDKQLPDLLIELWDVNRR